MRGFFRLLLGLLAPWLFFSHSFAEETIKILFLGDSTSHHVPKQRFEQIQPVLGRRGIEVSYTDNLQDLSASNLGRYDGLLLFANIDEIGPDQAKALIEYVEGGHGFIPVHCASYCFRNSSECVALIGGMFASHGTGTFETKILDSSHPALTGVIPFETWDETYVHSHHNPDKTVLMVREEGGKSEPWTWVRTQGKGRVFYTAYGHDNRTWAHPGFQRLLDSGIRWACQRQVHAEPAPELPPLEYEPSSVEIPNYLVGEKWGTTGEPIRAMQKPLVAEQSMKHMQTPIGFHVQLFAAEPDIVKPIAMTWDERGRLWICETFDYPNEMQKPGQGRDRIKICEDTNGDGKADKFSIFADKLSIPTSICFGGGGVIITQAPDILLLKDTNGDDKADSREVLIHGWGTNDTHAGPSNLRYGLDNRIWGVLGYSGYQGEVSGKELQFRQGCFRFTADGKSLQFLASTSNNTWGLGFSEDGETFISTANGEHSDLLAIPNQVYEGVRGWTGKGLTAIADHKEFHPVGKVRQVDHHHGFTAAAGHALYTARAYPQEFWNSTAFVCEPTGHLIHRLDLRQQGSHFVAQDGWNLMASSDEWTAPIAAEVGPDGAVWFIDWYNYIVQHNPTPLGFETGKGNAYETPLRDKRHGRIYRILYDRAPPYAPIRLDAGHPESLIAALRSDNMFWRLTAQRLLVQRGKTDVAQALRQLVTQVGQTKDASDYGAVHALWTLKGLNALDKETFEFALRHDHAPLVRAACSIAAEQPQLLQQSFAIVDSLIEHEMHGGLPVVRQFLLALSQCDPERLQSLKLGLLLRSQDLTKDRWCMDALTAAVAKMGPMFWNTVPEGAPHLENEAMLRLASVVAEHWARSDDRQEQLSSLLNTPLFTKGKMPSNMTSAVLGGLQRGWPAAEMPSQRKEVEAKLVALSAEFSGSAQQEVFSLADKWGMSQQFASLRAKLADDVRQKMLASDTPSPQWVDAARQLVSLRGNEEDIDVVLNLITARTSPELARQLLDTVASSQSENAADALLHRFSRWTPELRRSAASKLLSQPQWTERLLSFAQDGKVSLGDLALDQRQQLLSHPSAPIAQRARELLAAGGGIPNPDRQKVVEQFLDLANKSGDPGLGKEVFKSQCAKCHAYRGEGARIAPDLSGMAAHPKSELLVHILDPNRSVEGNYRQYRAVTNSGQIITGLLSRESATSIELTDAEGKTHALLREDLEDVASLPISLMPEGFEKLTRAELTHLLTFLTNSGPFLPLPLDKAATVVSTRGMFYSAENEMETLDFKDWGVKTFQGVPFVLIDPAGGSRANMVMLRGPQGYLPPKMPQQIHIPCGSAAKAIHLLGAVSGWGFPGGEVGKTSMIVRIHYADGSLEDHPLLNGKHVADYITRVDVPDSTFAFDLDGRQLRYVSIQPEKKQAIQEIEFVKGDDASAPIVAALTVERDG